LSILFQVDNDLKRLIVDATPRREPRIDFRTSQTAGRDDLDDEAVLRLAASQSRILVSHNKRTMPKAPAPFIVSGGTSPGVLLVISQNAPIREMVEALNHLSQAHSGLRFWRLPKKQPTCCFLLLLEKHLDLLTETDAGAFFAGALAVVIQRESFRDLLASQYGIYLADRLPSPNVPTKDA
jgi:hypothetical protein